MHSRSKKQPRYILEGTGKHIAACELYRRGKQFVHAALLLQERNNGDGYVVRHLLCQGIELLLKALLLLRDFDKYSSQLSDPKLFGHNLIALAEEVCSVYDRKMAPSLREEFEKLNAHFKDHLFRYAYIEGLLQPGEQFPIDKVLKRVKYVIRLMKRVLPPWA